MAPQVSAIRHELAGVSAFRGEPAPQLARLWRGASPYRNRLSGSFALPGGNRLSGASPFRRGTGSAACPPLAGSFALPVLCLVLLLGACATPGRWNAEMHPEVTQAPFGVTADGQAVTRYTLRNTHGMQADVLDFGATLHALHVPDREGNLADVVLGCDLACYETDSPYFGSTVGRYANRIAGGRFTLDGEEYTLAVNNPPNHLHGGEVGFDKVLWQAETYRDRGESGIRFTHVSPDMEEGYPGTLACTVYYILTDDNELKIEYFAETDAPTVVNLTHHSYFNLRGHDAGDMLDHELYLNADRYTPADETLIPTGAIDPVAGTPLDFRRPQPIGARIAETNGGYDHNFVLNKSNAAYSLAARVTEPESGRVMEIFTTEPGMQFYTGNHLNGVAGKESAVYNAFAGFCLEAQHFPDSPNQPHFPSTVLRPGERYHQLTVHRFYAR